MRQSKKKLIKSPRPIPLRIKKAIQSVNGKDIDDALRKARFRSLS